MRSFLKYLQDKALCQACLPDIPDIDMKDDVQTVTFYAPRPVASGMRPQTEDELDKMLKNDAIELIEQATDWCSDLTITPKTHKKIRMCVDLTNLNKGVKREIYPLPRINDMLSDLFREVVFSKLNANSGFWQLKLNPECKLLTTFVTL